MSKKRRFKNMDAQGRRITEPFVKLTKNLLASPAWKDLSPAAVCIYIEIRQRYNGSNNGEISLSCREAGGIAHCGKGTASNKLYELAEHGFIKESQKGMFTYKEASTWILTNEVYNNQPPSNEWKQWQSKKQSEVPVIELQVPVTELKPKNQAEILPLSSMAGT